MTVKANILISAQHTACLADFGLSTVLYNTDSLSRTTTGGTKGTIRWMSPELLGLNEGNDTEGRPARESDIYALSMVFWEVKP